MWWLPERGRRRALPAAALLAWGCAAAVACGGCGFRMPQLVSLQDTVPELVLEGDCREPFCRLVRRQLAVSGVVVHENGADRHPHVPQLWLPEPEVSEFTASVDSRAQALEYRIIVRASATLRIGSHRPLSISNSLTRTVLNKAGHALASDIEKQTVVRETMEELARELVLRVGYLGRMTDPDTPVPLPAELLASEEERIDVPARPLTLIEALQQSDARERAAARSVPLSELNHSRALRHELPQVVPELLNQPPQTY